MKYDAQGRLTSVTEANSFVTSYAYDPLDRLTAVCQGDGDGICGPTDGLHRSFVYSSRGKLLNETHPESGVTSYAYDYLGRVKQKQYAGASSPILYTYDLRDRLTKVDYPNDTDVLFYYDGLAVPGYEAQNYDNPISHLTGMVDAGGTTLWPSFSDREETLSRLVYFSGVTAPFALNYTYDTRGNLNTIQYPSRQVISIPRNNANAINGITRQFSPNPSSTLVTTVDYNAAILPAASPMRTA